MSRFLNPVSGVELVAVADVIEERAKATAEKFNVPLFYNKTKTYSTTNELKQYGLQCPQERANSSGFQSFKEKLPHSMRAKETTLIF